MQEVFTNNVMRVYTNEDIKGVELSGAMKNVIALGVGISTGLGYGDNARAALITRGIAEIARLGVAMGCNIHTFRGSGRHRRPHRDRHQYAQPQQPRRYPHRQG